MPAGGFAATAAPHRRRCPPPVLTASTTAPKVWERLDTRSTPCFSCRRGLPHLPVVKGQVGCRATHIGGEHLAQRLVSLFGRQMPQVCRSRSRWQTGSGDRWAVTHGRPTRWSGRPADPAKTLAVDLPVQGQLEIRRVGDGLRDQTSRQGPGELLAQLRRGAPRTKGEDSQIPVDDDRHGPGHAVAPVQRVVYLAELHTVAEDLHLIVAAPQERQLGIRQRPVRCPRCGTNGPCCSRRSGLRRPWGRGSRTSSAVRTRTVRRARG